MASARAEIDFGIESGQVFGKGRWGSPTATIMGSRTALPWDTHPI